MRRAAGLAAIVWRGDSCTEGLEYLPGHTTINLSAGKTLNEKLSLSVTALNVANRDVLVDNSLTFGGTHYNSPREVYVELRFRFHY